MVHAENQEWANTMRDMFDVRYPAFLVIKGLGDEEYPVREQYIVARAMVDSLDNPLEFADVDYKPDTGYLEIHSLVAAQDKESALIVLTHQLLEAIKKAGHEPSEALLVAAHMAYEEELKQLQAEAQGAAVSVEDMGFQLEEIDSFRMMDDGEGTTTAEAVFYQVRDEVAGLL